MKERKVEFCLENLLNGFKNTKIERNINLELILYNFKSFYNSK